MVPYVENGCIFSHGEELRGLYRRISQKESNTSTAFTVSNSKNQYKNLKFEQYITFRNKICKETERR